LFALTYSEFGEDMRGKFELDFRLLIPNVNALLFHFLIVAGYGLSVSGEHAAILAWSSILSIMLLLRGDVSLLSQPGNATAQIFAYSCISIVVIATIATVLVLFFGFQIHHLHYKIFLCGVAFSMNELVGSLYLKNKKIWGFVFIKCIPYPLFILLLATGVDLSIADLWLQALSFSVILASREIVRTLSFFQSTSTSIPKTFPRFFSRSLSAALTNCLVTFAANLPVILIGHFYGTRSAGIWINFYRIFALPLFYYSSAAQYTLLNKLSRLDSEPDRIYLSQIFWTRLEKHLIALSLASGLVYCFFYAIEKTIITELSLATGLTIIIYSFNRSFIQFLETVAQAANKSHIMSFFIIIELCFYFLFISLGPLRLDLFYGFLGGSAVVLYLSARLGFAVIGRS
jgi:hypothetical protein